MARHDTHPSRRPRRTLRARRTARLAPIAFGVGGLLLVGGVSTLGAAPAGASGGTVTVKLAHTKLGAVLVTAKGLTLYHFTPDGTTKVTCTAGCTSTWPPLLASGGKKASGVAGLGTIHGANGVQVTYHGQPLYLFAGDKAPGQVNGQGIENEWYAVQPSGARTAASGRVTTTTATKGYGSGY